MMICLPKPQILAIGGDLVCCQLLYHNYTNVHWPVASRQPGSVNQILKNKAGCRKCCALLSPSWVWTFLLPKGSVACSLLSTIIGEKVQEPNNLPPDSINVFFPYRPSCSYTTLTSSSAPNHYWHCTAVFALCTLDLILSWSTLLLMCL